MTKPCKQLRISGIRNSHLYSLKIQETISVIHPIPISRKSLKYNDNLEHKKIDLKILLKSALNYLIPSLVVCI
jgi:hypothetical protein